MKPNHIHILLASTVLLLAACASGPKTTSLLDQVHAEHQQAQGNPRIATYAALEMQAATEAMAKADAAAKDRESLEAIDKLAYLTKQKIALAGEVASRKASEADIANAAAVRDQVRLDQRTQEVNQARMKAQEAERSAQLARDAAASATQQKNLAQASESEAQRLAAEANARNQQLEAQLAELSAKKTERGLIITLGDVLFSIDQARLNPDGLRMVQRLATVLQQNPQRAVMVEGFTDSTGTSAHNQELSERRSAAVRDALLEIGVARTQITVRGYGALYPVAPNDTALNRQLNRRVEIVLSDERGVITPR
jgi:outer membrane protein OmpA-like peptidoglycan-associated protein